MLDKFGKKIGNIIKKIISSKRLDEQTINEILNDFKRTLLEADVDFKLANEITTDIKSKILKEKLPPGLTPREYLTKLIYDKLVEILGKEKFSLIGKKRIMLVGLFGSGKTTTAGKLAKYLQKRGLKVLLVGLDYHRPAAPQQLKQLAESIGVDYLIDEKSKNPYEVAKKSLSLSKKYDSIIYDTAGRSALDEELANELKKLAEIIKPNEVLLVIPADIGKTAGKQASEFHKLVNITGVIVTKLDGTAKAGGALAACSATKAKIKFIGVGEKPDDLEEYDPKRFVSRLLGFGDLEALLQKAKESGIKEEKIKKVAEGDLTLEDFLEQLKMIQKMGSLSSLVKLIPGFGLSLPEEMLKMQEGKLKKYKAIIQSMTYEERMDPDIINSSRIRRIAKGAGVSEQDVRELLSNYKKMKKILKVFKRSRDKNIMKMLGKFGGKLPFPF